MQATLTNTKTGQVIRLGGPKSSSWAPVWSPNGERVAFYSDEDGEAGLWVWEKATEKAARFQNLIARPFFGFEVVRWMSDNQRLLCKVLPVGMSIAEANALSPATEEKRRFPAVKPDEPSVFVLSAHSVTKKDGTPRVETSNAENSVKSNHLLADLAIVNWSDRTVVRVAERIQIPLVHVLSRREILAYSVSKGLEPNTQQPIYDLMVYDLTSGRSRAIGEGLRLSYGI